MEKGMILGGSDKRWWYSGGFKEIGREGIDIGGKEGLSMGGELGLLRYRSCKSYGQGLTADEGVRY
ncbi:hypothetical protein, partial [Staphylococcus epidermidis]|uniref:hypothetical protein n=1 Tax=Staphylococcus epidermidis TaxID=1282 RepID=UPI0037DA56A2